MWFFCIVGEIVVENEGDNAEAGLKGGVLW